LVVIIEIEDKKERSRKGGKKYSVGEMGSVI